MVVGAKAVVTFTFKNPVPLITGDLIRVSVPAEARKGIPLSLKECFGTKSKFLAAKLTCFLFNLAYVEVEIRLKDGVK